MATVTQVPVRGMTCRACEVRVGKALRAVPGVGKVEVSAGRGRARVELRTRVPHAVLVAAVESAGYEVGDDDRRWLSRDRRTWADAAAATAVVVLTAVVLRAVDPGGALGGLAGGLADGGVVVALVLGVAAGLSTCMALVGGLVLAVTARHATEHVQGPRAALATHLTFNAGRVVGFAAGGALLGGLGSVVRFDGTVVAVLSLAVALVMILLGLQLTRLSPRLARVGVALPASVATRLHLDSRTGAARHGGVAALGAASFLLPCGFTQAVQLFAISTGDVLGGAWVMAAFAVGTTPGLMAVGGLTASVRGPAAPRLLRFAGVVVVAFALVNVSGALTVLAPGLGASASATSASAGVSANVEVRDGVQVLRTVQDRTGYVPAASVVEAGTPVRWEIDSVDPSCASALLAPHVQATTVLLDSGVNVLEFTPTRPGTLHYSCAMGMYRGTIEVIAPASAQGTPDAPAS